jgi:hypothetical protein
MMMMMMMMILQQKQEKKKCDNWRYEFKQQLRRWTLRQLLHFRID